MTPADAPKYWMYETSGILAAAVRDYLEGKALRQAQVLILRGYLRQWVGHGHWVAPPGVLEALRLTVDRISTEADLRAAIEEAVALGMDPL